MKLLINALTKFTCGLLLVGLLLFLPAGTMDYGKGWLLRGLLFCANKYPYNSVFLSTFALFFFGSI